MNVGHTQCLTFVVVDREVCLSSSFLSKIEEEPVSSERGIRICGAHGLYHLKWEAHRWVTGQPNPSREHLTTAKLLFVRVLVFQLANGLAELWRGSGSWARTQLLNFKQRIKQPTNLIHTCFCDAVSLAVMRLIKDNSTACSLASGSCMLTSAAVMNNRAVY